jgi:hypothetical protein
MLGITEWIKALKLWGMISAKYKFIKVLREHLAFRHMVGGSRFAE